MGMGMYYRIACFFAYIYIYIEYIPDCNCYNIIIIIFIIFIPETVGKQ